MIYGIDVSHHNEWIDWPRVRQAGVRFAIIKASEGTGYIDPLFEQNLKGALEAGILPEIIIADGETNGALFTNDEIRMKVRHWVSVFVADYRPLYKANVA